VFNNKPFIDFNDFSISEVNPEFRSPSESLFAQRTLTLLPGIPVVLDAAQAKVVTTGDGGRVGEDVQTDAALELLLNRHGKGHVWSWKNKGKTVTTFA